jgi:hypothetical protein
MWKSETQRDHKYEKLRNESIMAARPQIGPWCSHHYGIERDTLKLRCKFRLRNEIFRRSWKQQRQQQQRRMPHPMPNTIGTGGTRGTLCRGVTNLGGTWSFGTQCTGFPFRGDRSPSLTACPSVWGSGGGGTVFPGGLPMAPVSRGPLTNNNNNNNNDDDDDDDINNNNNIV